MKKLEIKIPKVPHLFVDTKTNARTLALPFKLEDGSDAIMMICRLEDSNWFPEKTIKNITINYNENKTIGK